MPERSDPQRPRLALLMGDVAGVGPEVVARTLETHHQTANLLVVGHPGVLTRALDLVGLDQGVPAVVLQPAAMWKASRLSSRRSVAR